MMASPILQYFQESNSVPPPHNEQPSVLESSKELLRESEPQSQNMLDSHSSQIFQNQDSCTPFLDHSLEEKSSRKEYRNLAGVRTAISKIFFSVYR